MPSMPSIQVTESSMTTFCSRAHGDLLWPLWIRGLRPICAWPQLGWFSTWTTCRKSPRLVWNRSREFSRDLDLDATDQNISKYYQILLINIHIIYRYIYNLTNPRFYSSVNRISHCPFTSSSSGICSFCAGEFQDSFMKWVTNGCSF